eukprot:scaffold81806_cov56-Phaeocystis_antarctica.AAC.3
MEVYSSAFRVSRISEARWCVARQHSLATVYSTLSSLLSCVTHLVHIFMVPGLRCEAAPTRPHARRSFSSLLARVFSSRLEPLRARFSSR